MCHFGFLVEQAFAAMAWVLKSVQLLFTEWSESLEDRNGFDPFMYETMVVTQCNHGSSNSRDIHRGIEFIQCPHVSTESGTSQVADDTNFDES